MNKIQMLANRNLRPRTLSSGETRGLRNYYAFSHDRYPVWWKLGKFPKEYRDAIGIYENIPSSPDRALILRQESLCVLDTSLGEAARIRYAAIDSLDKFSKNPVSEAIGINLYSGKKINIPVLGRTGAIVDVIRFLYCAADASQPGKC